MQAEDLNECHACLVDLNMGYPVFPADDLSTCPLIALFWRSDSKVIGGVLR